MPELLRLLLLLKMSFEPGDIISIPVEGSSGVGIIGVTHHGVVTFDNQVIGKSNDGNLNKETIWKNAKLFKKGSTLCVAHALNRFSNGKEVNGNPNIHVDKLGYNIWTANCQNFADDCFIQQDGKGRSVDVDNYSGLIKSSAVSSGLGSSAIGAGVSSAKSGGGSGGIFSFFGF